VVSRPPDDERSQIAALVHQLTTSQRAATPSEVASLRRYFASSVLPERPTARVLEKHGQHVEDDIQWPADASPDDYLESLRDTVLNPRSGIYLAETELDRMWTAYFVGPVPTARAAGVQAAESWYSSTRIGSSGSRAFRPRAATPTSIADPDSGPTALDNRRCNETEHSTISPPSGAISLV